jgi:transcriptional regulator with XRE-family HTH domain
MAKTHALLPAQQKTLARLSENIKFARLRRDISTTQAAERAGISRTTLYKVENGDPAVTIGVYLKVLYTLNLDADLLKVAADDELGRALQDAKLTVRKRASIKCSSKHAPKAGTS